MADEKPKVASFITVNPGKRMKVRTIAETRIAGRHVSTNTIAEVTEDVGYELITAGKAEKHTDKPEKSDKDS
ncbi:hypothetical protein [Edaphobacter albus]|uniref:hypothetical protein n=1 Tax=Edaphobacter sp. 4G125 TaxID=2763071 RepID=UPI00164952C2|nr:hypothetical protein [Edaphobacter sp. 4G125]QNI37519.1 hypothetical protein H7846_04235 [Edaphobacter sp. 4G125]